MKAAIFIAGVLLLLAAEFFRIYFIMPFPGSQVQDSLSFSYFAHQYIFLVEITAVVMIAVSGYFLIRFGGIWKKIFTILPLLLCTAIYLMAHLVMSADKIFIQTKNLSFSTAGQTLLDKEKLVVGIEINGEAKAYPINYIAYHHQVRDTVGGELVMVTYCSVCRSGRVFSPIVNGKPETFRLVGMDHFNAMFEDETTGTWWRQENGEAAIGKLKGQFLEELPSQQMTLRSWITLHPNALIMNPDPEFADQYASLDDYDYGKRDNKLSGTDTTSWSRKSWVLGIAYDEQSIAIDWNRFKRERVINNITGNEDGPGGVYFVAVLENDDQSFHVLQRDKKMKFYLDQNDMLTDNQTQSIWNLNGLAIEGELTGTQLTPLQAYQEFWHSWKYFHPDTEQY